jgi:ribonuclease D
MINSSDNFYITSQKDLNQAVDLIKKVKFVAVDTEFTRQTTYYPLLSIIQLAVKNGTKKQSFIIDCLLNLNLSELFAIIADPEIIKVLHSSTQDLQIFYQHSKLLPQSIADTQIMANFCGFGCNFGYSALVDKLFNLQLDKKQQRSNWQLRPLSIKQIEYAFLDVVFLEEIYKKFHEVLLLQKRVEWYLEEMKNFVNNSLFKSNESLTKSFSFKDKNDLQIARIKNLILWRENQARKNNIARQHYLKDADIKKIISGQKVELKQELTDIIYKILEEKNENFDKLEFTENFETPGFFKEFSGEKVCGSEVFVQRRFIMNKDQKIRYLRAKKLISTICIREKFQEQFLITGSDLKKIICAPNSVAKILSGWRYQLFGQELEQIIF